MKVEGNMKAETITIHVLLNYLKEQLDCNQKIIAAYTGLNESTLSANLEKSVEEVATKKTGKKVVSLYFVVHHFANMGLSPSIIKEALNEFVYEDLEGNFDSVISAIHSDKYEPSALVNIAKLGYQKYQEKLEARDVLFPALREVITYTFLNELANPTPPNDKLKDAWRRFKRK